MTVVFVAPDDSDDEDLSNGDGENHLKYRFITDETDGKNRKQRKSSSSANAESIRTIKPTNCQVTEKLDTLSIDSNHRFVSLNHRNRVAQFSRRSFNSPETNRFRLAFFLCVIQLHRPIVFQQRSSLVFTR